MTREASLQELLGSSFEYHSSTMYTSIPGVIVAVRDKLNQQYVDVQPLINLRSEDGTESIPRPSILNVPLHMPCTDQGGMTYPISKGTSVWLMFSMRGIDKWKRGNAQPDTPSDRRMFDINDCFALPGVYPIGLSPNDASKRSLSHDTSDVVLVHNVGSGNEVEVRLKASGDVEINAPNRSVKVNCKDAEITAEDSVSVETQDFSVESENFSVNTTNYSLVATGENVSEGNFRFQGTFELNGIHMESHVHVETNSVTQGPQN